MAAAEPSLMRVEQVKSETFASELFIGGVGDKKNQVGRMLNWFVNVHASQHENIFTLNA